MVEGEVGGTGRESVCKNRFYDFHLDMVKGWLSIGPDLTSSNYSKDKYLSFFEGADGFLLGQSDEIEGMRPRTPPMKSRGGSRGGGPGRGGGPTMRGGIGRGGPPPMGRGGMPGRSF